MGGRGSVIQRGFIDQSRQKIFNARVLKSIAASPTRKSHIPAPFSRNSSPFTNNALAVSASGTPPLHASRGLIFVHEKRDVQYIPMSSAYPYYICEKPTSPQYHAHITPIPHPYNAYTTPTPRLFHAHKYKHGYTWL